MDHHPDLIRFDTFTLDLANRQLRRGGEPVELGSRYFDALTLLVRESGTLVTKDRFMDEVWRGIPVTDEALTQCIRTLRRALQDDAAHPRFIATVPKHGYRFIAPLGPIGVEIERVGSASPPYLAGACTLAGGIAGALGGLFYAMVAGQGSVSGFVALAAMVGALGTLAGAGIGLALAATLVWRSLADAWLLAGGMVGGMLTGALGNTLGREGIELLTDRTVGNVTGVFEGAILGLASGTAAWMTLRNPTRSTIAIATAAAIGALAGAVLNLSGGSLLGGSLWNLQQSLGHSRLALERVGELLGESDFGSLAHFATAVIEASVFISAITIAALATSRKPSV